MAAPAALARGACPLCGIDYPRTRAARGPDFEYRTTGDQEFEFCRCTSCGTVVLDPRPADHEIARLYPPEYEPYRFERLNPVVKAGRDAVQRRKASVLAGVVPKGGTIVDVGCGNGSLLRLMREDYGDRFQLIGWDYPGPHLQPLVDAGITTIGAPIEPAHVPQNVDLFVLNQVIEHVPYPDRLIAMLARALKPGGHLIIETPDTNGIDARWFAGRYWGGYHIPRHLVLFNQQSLHALIERCGMQVVESAHLASPAFWVQSLHHFLSESRVPALASLMTLRNAPLVACAAIVDMVSGRLGRTSNQRVIARRPQ